jgi:hypothetical protein
VRKEDYRTKLEEVHVMRQKLKNFTIRSLG